MRRLLFPWYMVVVASVAFLPIVLSVLFFGGAATVRAAPVLAGGVAVLITGLFAWVSISRKVEVLRREISHGQRSMKDSISYDVAALKSTSSSGVEKVYENQGKLLADYASIVGQTKVRVDVFGATLISFLWNPDFENCTSNALRRGVNFRVLILDPTSDAVKSLLRQEQRTDESFARELKSSIERWQELESKVRSLQGGRMEIRTFDGVPSSFLMITDDRLFFAPYLHSVSIVAAPCFEVKARAGIIYQTYRDYFEKMWMQSSTIAKSR